jgi:hypothetical protein
MGFLAFALLLFLTYGYPIVPAPYIENNVFFQ